MEPGARREYQAALNRCDPCVRVSCRWHLYLDVHPTSGSIKLNFPDKEPDELQETCALAVANRGGDVLDAVGATMNITRERIRQLVSRALTKLARALGEARGLDGRTAPMPKGSVADRAALVRAQAWLASNGVCVEDLVTTEDRGQIEP